MKRKLYIALALFGTSPSGWSDPAIQSIDSLMQVSSQFVLQQLPGDAEYQVSPGTIDPRLQLPLCDQPLNVFAQGGEVKPGRNTIGVRCTGSKSWQIFNTVLVKAYKQVLILNTALKRNDVVRAEHLSSEVRDIGALNGGYLNDASQIVDKQVTRNLAPGTVLNRQHYTDAMLIKRGQQVSIQSGSPGLMISAPGVAMSDGVMGQTISVKNLSSARVLQAVVINAQHVMVNR